MEAGILVNGGRAVLLGAFLLLCVAVTGAETIPGTRMKVDWAKLISAQDITLAAPPTDTVHGLLLGNGDIGVSVFGPPECLTLQVGKSDIWDYRDPIDAMPPALSQADLLAMFMDPNSPKEQIQKNDRRNGEFQGAYTTPQHTAKPAGQIRFRNEMPGTGGSRAAPTCRLHLWDAEVTAALGTADARVSVPYQKNVVAVVYTPKGEQTFDIELARHHDATGQIPNGPEFGANGREIWLRYRFPADPATYPKGFEYAMVGRVIGGDVTSTTMPDARKIKAPVWYKGEVETTEGVAVAHVKSAKPVTLLVAIVTSRDAGDPLTEARRQVGAAEKQGLASLTRAHRSHWHDFWQRSLVQILGRDYLTQHWFVSNYHLACCSRPGAIAPGLYGNWTWEDGSAWWSDFHWDYNFQQTFWGAYSSNHLEQAEPYNDTVLALLPAAKAEAREVYGLEGAKYFLTSYPRKTARNPFPVYALDRIMCLSAWAAQEMWMYYAYSQDKRMLREQAYPVMKECAKFYEGFLTKNAAGRYEIWPTVSPEHWGMDAGLTRNRNCTADLALIRYLLRGCVAASQVLGVDAGKRAVWQDIADHLADYPTADTKDGKVIVDVDGVPPIAYNVPVPAFPMFPGDDIGLDSPASVRATAERTVRGIPYNLANQYVMLPMAKVRLGMNVLDEFETATNHLRYDNGVVIDEGMPWIWTENFAAPVVLNESLVQSHAGHIRIAPVKLSEGARFARLRTEGAFLVSGEIRPGGDVAYLAVTSEAGGTFRIVNPWSGRVRIREARSMKEVASSRRGDDVTFETQRGKTYVLDRPSAPWEALPVTSIAGR